MDDRRSTARAKVNLKVTWEGLLTILKGEIVDLSMSGCFVLSDDKVAMGELIRLEIQKPGGGDLYLWAEVVYQMAEIGFGVRFTGGEDAEMQRLEWLVKAELFRAEKESEAPLEESSSESLAEDASE
jgi:hypothetical protein